MSKQSLRSRSQRLTLILALVLVPATKVLAQESPLAASMKTTLTSPVASSIAAPVAPSGYVQTSSYVHTTQFKERDHRFWDRDNSVLFVAVGAAATADFLVTRSNLAHGGRELNPVTGMFAGSTAGLAVNFAGETAGSIGVSYLFHKTGHHRLERLTSFVNISASAGAVGFGLTHR